jgi:hypothetical protein
MDEKLTSQYQYCRECRWLKSDWCEYDVWAKQPRWKDRVSKFKIEGPFKGTCECYEK